MEQRTRESENEHDSRGGNSRAPTKGIGVNYVEPRLVLSSSCLARSSRATKEGVSPARDPR